MTLPLNEDFISYPSDPKIQLTSFKNIPDQGSNVTKIILGSHCGTHVDSPYHIFENGKKLSDFPLNYFFGKATVVNISNYKKFISSDYKEFDFVFYDSHWMKLPITLDFYNSMRPEIPLELIEYLIDKKIFGFGCDMPSVDQKSSKDKIIHKLLLGNDILIYENVCNLDKFNFNEQFMFYGLPLSLKLDGSPIRAMGVKNENSKI